MKPLVKPTHLQSAGSPWPHRTSVQLSNVHCPSQEDEVTLCVTSVLFVVTLF